MPTPAIAGAPGGAAAGAVTVRRLAHGEIPRLRALSHEWLQFCDERGMLFRADDASLEAWMSVLQTLGTDLIFVAESEGDLVGVCFWHFLKPPFDPTVVSGLGTFVRDGLRRRGIGAQLRRAATAAAIERGATAITGAVYGNDTAAMESAKALGFTTSAIQIRKALG